jgi:cob(I)alamin adenosyltransferase
MTSGCITAGCFHRGGKMTAFYTRKGDDGTTGILGAERVSKSDERIEALGSIDELTSALGMARSLAQTPGVSDLVSRVQRNLYSLMSEVAAEREIAPRVRTISEEHVKWLEEQTDRISEAVGVPQGFILPGEIRSGAAFSMARAIARRAERRVVALHDRTPFENIQILHYLNRLSSLCFVLELQENHTCEVETQMASKSRKSEV